LALSFLGDETARSRLTLTLTNPLLAEVIDRLARATFAGSAQPTRILQEALLALPDWQTDRGSGHLSSDAAARHDEIAAYRTTVSNVAGAHVASWGGLCIETTKWLSRLGASHIELDPTTGAASSADIEQRPTLVVDAGTIETAADPARALLDVRTSFSDRGWNNVPLMVFTADPDYFLPELPRTSEKLIPGAAAAGHLPPVVRDPADWEDLFASTGYFVLEQRPIHLNLLPPGLASALDACHQTHFARMPGRVPARQGPHYLWLLAPRKMHAPAENQSIAHAETYAAVENYTASEPVELPGNLGARTYHVEDGSVAYRSDALELSMNFRPGEFFGQLELTGNYVASRVLGTVQARSPTHLIALRSADFRRQLLESEDLGHKVFLSLTRHLDSIRYDAFITAKAVKKQEKSKVLMASADPGQDEGALGHTQNYAAALLHHWTQAVAMCDTQYRSRVAFVFGPEDFKRLIYGTRSRQDNVLDVIPSFVQASVIDCFSPCLINRIDKNLGDDEQFQDDISELTFEDVDLSTPLHIGWLAARYLEYQFPDADDLRFERVSELGLGIGAMLGCDKDQKRFSREHAGSRLAERGNKSQGGKKRMPRLPRRPAAFRDWVLGKLGVDRATSDRRADDFLDELCKYLRFNHTRHYEERLGLSELIVVRDIWPLLACLLDDARMWRFDRSSENLQHLILKPQQRTRLIAYYQEAVALIGQRVGFDRSPW
jgi:CRP-like cAMP-binding protein